MLTSVIHPHDDNYDPQNVKIIRFHVGDRNLTIQ